MELKLVQELASVDQDPILLVLLDLKESVQQPRSRETTKNLRGLWVDTKPWGLHAEIWLRQELVTRQNGFHAPQLLATRGNPQWGLAFPTLLNVAVDIVFHHWMSLTVEDESATHEGLRIAVGWCMGVFYEYYGTIGSRDPEWLQEAINVLIGLFIRVRLMDNVE